MAISFNLVVRFRRFPIGFVEQEFLTGGKLVSIARRSS
jgi:hypothetical protein